MTAADTSGITHQDDEPDTSSALSELRRFARDFHDFHALTSRQVAELLNTVGGEWAMRANGAIP